MLDAPENGGFNMVGPVPAYLTHSIAEFYCDEGYEHESEIQTALICNADGQWSSDVPECHETECDPDIAGEYCYR